MSRRAFTLLEILVVLGISAVLAGMAISYSNVSRNYVALSIETAKISQFIIQAKQLALATYASSATSCGYGVVFSLGASPQTYSIFAYSPSGVPSCPSAAATAAHLSAGLANDEIKPYLPSTWQVPISRGVTLQPQANSLVAIIFYPPDPTVFLSTDGIHFPALPATLQVHLATADNSNQTAISVNPGGQVSF